MTDGSMRVGDLVELLTDLPDDAIVQIHDAYYGTDDEFTGWVFIVEANSARLVLGRGDNR